MNLVFCGGVRTSAKMMKVEFVPIEDEAWGELPGRQECCCIYRRSTYGWPAATLAYLPLGRPLAPSLRLSLDLRRPLPFATVEAVVFPSLSHDLALFWIPGGRLLVRHNKLLLSWYHNRYIVCVFTIHFYRAEDTYTWKIMMISWIHHDQITLTYFKLLLSSTSQLSNDYHHQAAIKYHQPCWGYRRLDKEYWKCYDFSIVIFRTFWYIVTLQL